MKFNAVNAMVILASVANASLKKNSRPKGLQVKGDSAGCTITKPGNFEIKIGTTKEGEPTYLKVHEIDTDFDYIFDGRGKQVKVTAGDSEETGEQKNKQRDWKTMTGMMPQSLLKSIKVTPPINAEACSKVASGIDVDKVLKDLKANDGKIRTAMDNM